MVTAAARLGTVPTSREIADEALALVRELAARVAVLEARADADDAVDGDAPAPLPPNWVPLKQAALISGYSASALRKLRSPTWWKYVASRVWIDIAACPRKAV